MCSMARSNSVCLVVGAGNLLLDETETIRISQLEQKVALRDARIAGLQVGHTSRLDSR